MKGGGTGESGEGGERGGGEREWWGEWLGGSSGQERE